MDCLYAKSTPVITDCVMAELEKLGPRYRIALRIAKDPRFERLKCDHKGTYADDCIVNRVMQNKVYIVATNDVDLKRRIRKIPGVPIMSCGTGKCVYGYPNPLVMTPSNKQQVRYRTATRRTGEVSGFAGCYSCIFGQKLVSYGVIVCLFRVTGLLQMVFMSCSIYYKIILASQLALAWSIDSKRLE
jgi:rRNA-processing protein FCF1